VTPPSWIESSDTEGNVGSEVEGKEQIICMMSPEQKLPQPRKWNVKSPEHKKTVSTRKTSSDTRNESIAGRTRSQRRK